MAPTPKPIACTLSNRAAERQALEWTELSGKALTTNRLADGIAMTFDLAMANDVEDLARREATCCGFLSIETSRTEDVLSLTITSDNPDAGVVINALTAAPPL